MDLQITALEEDEYMTPCEYKVRLSSDEVISTEAQSPLKELLISYAAKLADCSFFKARCVAERVIVLILSRQTMLIFNLPTGTSVQLFGASSKCFLAFE